MTATATTTFRSLNLPVPIAVETDAQDEPAWVTWRGQRRAVAAIADRWRIDDEWWRNPISRLYFTLTLADDQTLIVFHDLRTGRWYAQRYARQSAVGSRQSGGDAAHTNQPSQS